MTAEVRPPVPLYPPVERLAFHAETAAAADYLYMHTCLLNSRAALPILGEFGEFTGMTLQPEYASDGERLVLLPLLRSFAGVAEPPPWSLWRLWLDQDTRLEAWKAAGIATACILGVVEAGVAEPEETAPSYRANFQTGVER